ncbi:MAG: Zn-ribbon domain-containing OB-fold protein, partial [Thermaurantiacus sp.]
MTAATDAALWAKGLSGPVPLGVRCGACGAVNFPRSRRCRCCGSPDVETVHLATTGRIVAMTRIRQSAEVPVIAVADVRLSDGTLMFGRIEPADDCHIGAQVRFAGEGQS